MEKSSISCSSNHFILKVSRLFPSSFASCHFRTLPDVADTSTVPISKLIPNDLSSSALPKLCRNSPPPIPVSNPKKRGKLLVETRKTRVSNVNQSSSSYSGCFSSSDDRTRPENADIESDTFFSLSSNSGGDSFRLKSSRRFCDEMKRIDEKGSRSFSSVNSSNTVLTKSSGKSTVSSSGKAVPGGKKKYRKTSREHELISSDHMSTQLYYAKNGGYHDSNFRQHRRSVKNRRRAKRTAARRSLECDSVMKESYAVEKKSRDPRGDFWASMVEMIVEKQMMGEEELERLLLCFLSLNSESYHGMIIDVFTEICETLFRN